MGLEFIDRTLKTAAIVLLLFLPFGLFYYGIYPSLAIFSGGVWGLLNLIFISALIRETIRPEKVKIGNAVVLALIKFPLLYASLYFLLKVSQFSPVNVAIGLSGILAIIVLKGIGRVLLSSDSRSSEEPSAERVSAQ